MAEELPLTGHALFIRTSPSGIATAITILFDFHSTIPDKQRPLALTVSVNLQKPAPGGVAEDPNEIKLLGDLSEKMFEALKSVNSEFVSMFTSAGKRTWLQYCSTSEGVEQIIRETFASQDEYSPVIEIEPDPQWSKYSALFPNAAEQASIRFTRQLKAAKMRSTAITVALVKQLRERGDNLQAREIDYAIDFASPEARDKVADFLAKNGFTIQQNLDSGQNTNQNSVNSLYATRASPVNPTLICNVEALLIHLALENGGKYDGWGCRTNQPPKAAPTR